MTSTFTPNVNWELQATGDNPNAWGTHLNDNVFSVGDLNLGGRLSISVAGSADVTPTQTQANNLSHTLTGILTGSISYILPNKGRFYIVKNSTTGAFTVTVKISGGTGTIVPQGQTMLVFCNPSTTVATAVFDSVSNLTVNGTLSVTGASTHTGVAGFAAGSVTAPSIGFTGDPDTGLYSSSANQLAITAGGVDAARFNTVASGVNYLSVTGGATGNGVAVSAAGADVNIAMNINGKGAAAVNLNPGGGVGLSVSNVVNAVNYVRINGTTAGGTVFIQPDGTDTDVPMALCGKGTGTLSLLAGGAVQMVVQNVTGAVNQLTVNGSVSGSPGTVSLSATGSDSNIDLVLFSKGSGVIKLGGAGSFIANAAVASVFTANVGPTGAHTAIQGWEQFRDSGGTMRYRPYW